MAVLNEEVEIGWIGCCKSSTCNYFYFEDDATVDGQNYRECISAHLLAQVKVNGCLICKMHY